MAFARIRRFRSLGRSHHDSKAIQAAPTAFNVYLMLRGILLHRLRAQRTVFLFCDGTRR